MGRIERILGKIPALDVPVKENVIVKDLTESPGEAELVDPASDLTEGEVEPHIVSMFSRDDVAARKETETTELEDQDNSITELSSKEMEEEPVKVPQKNGQH